MILRRTLLAVLGLTMLIGLVISEEPLGKIYNGAQFNYEDSTSGIGSFASNNKITTQGPHADARAPQRLADVILLKKDHGSGTIDKETIISSKKSIEIQNEPSIIYAYAMVAALSNSSMVYAPQTMSIGNGYYATHPVSFKSLLGDTAQIKNYASETSMGQEIERAQAINLDLVASVEDDYSGWNPSKGLARTLMNLDGGVNSGTAHIEVLQGNTSDLGKTGKIAWYNPNIDIEEDYTGTFDIATEMNLTLPVTKIVGEDSWLSCCFGGWVDLMDSDKMGFGTDVKGIFDCTCPKVPAKVPLTSTER